MEENLSHNTELKNMFVSDQEDREDWKNWPADKTNRDKQRLARTLQLIDVGALTTGEDYYHASMILQHSNITEHYKLANELCQNAIKLGEERAKWLYAAALDRYMLNSGEKYQKYGTQYMKGENGWYLCPIDPNTTDEDRAEFNVLPLKDLETKVTELNS